MEKIIEKPWEEIADDVLSAVSAKMVERIKDFSENLYEHLLCDTQDYLIDNARFNIGERISSAKRDAQSARAERDNLKQVNERLVEALELFLKEYIELVESGDAGFWDAEKESKVITARSALKAAQNQKDADT